MKITHTVTSIEMIRNRKLTIEDGPLVKTAMHAYTQTSFRVDAVTFVNREPAAAPHLAILEGFAVDKEGRKREPEKRYSRLIRSDVFDSQTYSWLNELLEP
ncbi:hypothetical protein [[Arthrobacter] sp. ATCC 21022]|uniref:Uncharacterized protein n=1 Tax=Arthrobacter phage BossLady TaxID=2603258 RepID=A0A5B8WGC4_9CAUD|nr:hypothetical protein JM67_03505 [Arthrobacter sp. ATCC 21022]QED11794.1 hypothetical protein SEA_BOSSLADY_56 [Arthrobacter phage BossLady]